MLPLRQFKGISEEVVKRLEKKDISWKAYYDFTSNQLGEMLKSSKLGKFPDSPNHAPSLLCNFAFAAKRLHVDEFLSKMMTEKKQNDKHMSETNKEFKDHVRVSSFGCSSIASTSLFERERSAIDG